MLICLQLASKQKHRFSIELFSKTKVYKKYEAEIRHNSKAKLHNKVGLNLNEKDLRKDPIRYFTVFKL